MSDANVINLTYELLKKMQLTVARIEERMAAIDQRMEHLERRQTASTHFEQSVLAHLAAIHESGDNAVAESRATKRTVEQLQNEMLDVKHRLELLEAH